MIHALSKQTDLSMLFSSERPLALPYHWVGRTVMCAGDDCPACALRTPKLFFYAAGVRQRQLTVIEMCPSFVDHIDRLLVNVVRQSWRGVVVRASRKSNRHEWRIDEFNLAEDKASVATEAFVAGQIATLYRVRGLNEGETLAAWLHAVRASQKAVLQNCQLV